MTENEIIRMAHEASPDMTWYAAIDNPSQASADELAFLERFAALVSEATKEKAAKLCEAQNLFVGSGICAAAIRSMK